MRIKNDTIIKWSNIAATMNLTNEEIGCLFRNVMLEDDVEKVHHENVPSPALKFLKEKEEEWRNDYIRLSAQNPQLIQAFITVFGQVSHSHQAFDKLQERYDIKDFERVKKSKKKEDKNDLFSEVENNRKTHNFNVFGVSFSIEFENEIEFLSEDLEYEFSEVEEYAKYDEVLFKDIINKSFKLAVKDNFKKSLKDYCCLVLEEI